tara:strand:+ start:63 stop:362 length:300 start_codon:yes stop_codon:yes gene_type:complete
MAEYRPKIRLNSQGFPILKCTAEASAIKKSKQNAGSGRLFTPLCPDKVLADAKQCIVAEDFALTRFHCNRNGPKWTTLTGPGDRDVFYYYYRVPTGLEF